VRFVQLVLIAAWASNSALAQVVTQMDPRRAPPAEITAPKALLEPEVTYSIVLPPPTDLERASLRDFSVTHPAVGFGRMLMGLGVDGRIVAPTGVRTVQVIISSPGAAHLRTRIAFEANSAHRVSASPIGSDRNAEGPIAIPPRSHPFWTPITDGGLQRLLIEFDGDDKAPSMTIDLVSHIESSLTAQPLTMQLKAAASCQVDYACIYALAPAYAQPALSLASEAVARMVYTTSTGTAFLCTGTLLNSASYPTPMFLTAAHCISDQQTANSLVTYWHYRRDLCGTGSVSPSMRQIGGGATLL